MFARLLAAASVGVVAAIQGGPWPAPEAGPPDDLVKHLPGHPADRPLGVQFAGYASVVAGADPVPGKDSLFYWFVGARNGRYWERPIALWTNGGPGSSSFWGFFAENGPYTVQQDGDNLTLTPRPHAWSDYVNYLIVEHPLNVTLSAAAGPLPQSVEEGASQWHHAIRNFARKHLELAGAPWLLTGESYAGTYLTLLAREISRGNAACLGGGCAPLVVRAVLLGDAWVDPITQLAQDIEYAYIHGLISGRKRRQLDAYWRPRSFYCGGLGVGWNETGYCSMPQAEWTATVSDEIYAIAGKPYMANIARYGDPPMEPARRYLNQASVREALHVPEGIPLVAEFFSAPISQLWGHGQFKSYKGVLQDLLDGGLQVVVLSGLNDAKDCGFLGTAAYLDTLAGQVAERFQEAETRAWRAAVRMTDMMLPNEPRSLPAAFSLEQCDGSECCGPDELCDRLLGYVQSADDGGLSFVKVLNAGHLAAADQPLIIDLLLNMTHLA